MWSHWALHADALVEVLTDEGLSAVAVSDPGAQPGLLVAEAVLVEDLMMLERRTRAGGQTIVWGGTLPVPRIAALREAGAAAYVPMLQTPRELVEVVARVQAGEDVTWTEWAGPASALTERERSVAHAYLVEWADETRAEVAARIGISDRTLKVHVANIRAKTGHRGTHTREGLRRSLTVRGWLD